MKYNALARSRVFLSTQSIAIPMFPIVIAAAAAGIVYTLSTIATSSIEEIAEAAPTGINWFQLYIYKDRYLKNINNNAFHFPLFNISNLNPCVF
jgi:hypothetical protein